MVSLTSVSLFVRGTGAFVPTKPMQLGFLTIASSVFVACWVVTEQAGKVHEATARRRAARGTALGIVLNIAGAFVVAITSSNVVATVAAVAGASLNVVVLAGILASQQAASSRRTRKV